MAPSATATATVGRKVQSSPIRRRTTSQAPTVPTRQRRQRRREAECGELPGEDAGDARPRGAQHLHDHGLVHAPPLGRQHRAGQHQHAGQDAEQADDPRWRRPILPSTSDAVSMASRMRTTVTLGNWSVTVLKIASSASGVAFTVARKVCGALSSDAGREDEDEIDRERLPFDAAQRGDRGLDVAAQHVHRDRVAELEAEGLRPAPRRTRRAAARDSRPATIAPATMREPSGGVAE